METFPSKVLLLCNDIRCISIKPRAHKEKTSIKHKKVKSKWELSCLWINSWGQDIMFPHSPLCLPKTCQKMGQKMNDAQSAPAWIQSILVLSCHHYCFQELRWTTHSSSWAVGPPALIPAPLHRQQLPAEGQSTKTDIKPLQLHVLELISCHPLSYACCTQATEEPRPKFAQFMLLSPISS